MRVTLPTNIMRRFSDEKILPCPLNLHIFHPRFTLVIYIYTSLSMDGRTNRASLCSVYNMT